MPSRLTVRTTISQEGFHRWPNAPEDVEFLRNVHRHLFRITAEVEVDHWNRDVEFFILQRSMRNLMFHPDNIFNTFATKEGSTSSCEELAEEFASRLLERGYKPVMVEVSEDGESAGRWYRD